MTKMLYMFSDTAPDAEAMGRELIASHREAAALYEAAEAILADAASPHGATPEGSADRETSARRDLATFIYSLAVWATLPDELREGAALAGYSLGEYTALTAAGVLTLEEGLRLVQARADALAEAAATEGGATYRILGLDDRIIERHLAEDAYRELVWISAYRAPGQAEIGGLAGPCAEAADDLRARGARLAERLTPDAAPHTILMHDAAVATAAVAEAEIPMPGLTDYVIYGNQDGQALPPLSSRNFPGYVARHMTEPVHWHQTLTQATGEGIDTFIELGPGTTLFTLAKRTLYGATVTHTAGTEALGALIQHLTP